MLLEGEGAERDEVNRDQLLHLLGKDGAVPQGNSTSCKTSIIGQWKIKLKNKSINRWPMEKKLKINPSINGQCKIKL